MHLFFWIAVRYISTRENILANITWKIITKNVRRCAKRLCNLKRPQLQWKTFYYCPFDLYVWHFEFWWKYLETLKLSRHCHKKYFAKKIWCNRAASSRIFKKRKKLICKKGRKSTFPVNSFHGQLKLKTYL